jgi:hypothetical protein
MIPTGLYTIQISLEYQQGESTRCTSIDWLKYVACTYYELNEGLPA